MLWHRHTRLPAAAIEQNHDAKGIIWPDALAPFTVVICPIGMDRSTAVKDAAERLHVELEALGIDVMLDIVEQRAPQGFTNLESVLPSDELEKIVGDYKKLVAQDRETLLKLAGRPA